MTEQRYQTARKRGLARRVGPPVHDDLVTRQFTAAGPDELWLTDITEHPSSEGKLYLCAIKDVWSNRIVGTTRTAIPWESRVFTARDPANVQWEFFEQAWQASAMAEGIGVMR